MQVCTLEREKSKGNSGQGVPAASESLVAAKTAYDKAKQALEASKLAAITEIAKAFELHGNQGQAALGKHRLISILNSLHLSTSGLYLPRLALFSFCLFLMTFGLGHYHRIIQTQPISKNNLGKVQRSTAACQHTPSNIRRSTN